VSDLNDINRAIGSLEAQVHTPWWVQYSTTWLGWIAALAAAIVGIWRVVQLFRSGSNGKRD
jgi:ABC-type uncharacterized transport system permease subunit